MCSNHFCNFPGYPEAFQVSQTFQAIRKFSGSSGKYAAYPETFQAIQKLFRSSGKYPAYPENIQPIWKTSSLSRKYPAYPETFQTIRKKSRLSGNFPKGPETSQCNFKGYAQKLSGRAKTFRMAMPPCHPGFWDSAILVTCHLLISF